MLTSERLDEDTAVANLEEGHICWWNDKNPRVVYMTEVSGLSKTGPEVAQLQCLLGKLERFTAELREKLKGGLAIHSDTGDGIVG